jgi:CubicO group peptidase (beta-lactamase class C family)
MMKAFLTTATMLLLATTLLAQTKAPAQPLIGAEALHRLDSLFHYLNESGLYNGNILVAEGGKKKAFAAIGYANLETKERLTEASTFELASCSKQFTAVGILTLVATGKLSLDQQLETLFPGFPYKGVTIRHLLNHTGGLPDYMSLMHEHWDHTLIATNADVLAMFQKYHPAKNFEPGANWEYSNTGYALLASVIEKVSGKSFAKYMKEAVFTPLHLNHTLVYMRRYAPQKIPGYAYGYIEDSTGAFKLPDDVPDAAYVIYLDGIGGDGCVNTTVGDLLIWNNAVRDKKLLPAELWKEALTPPVINGKNTNYGFGFQVVENPERGRVLMHNGGWPGYTTRNVLYLEKDISLIYLCNKQQSGAIMEATWTAVKNIVFGQPAEFPKPLVQVVAEVDKSLYKLYSGTYAATEQPDFELKVRTDGDHLFIQATGQSEAEVMPEALHRFFIPDFPITIEFVPDGPKPSPTLILNQNGKHEFKRKL